MMQQRYSGPNAEAGTREHREEVIGIWDLLAFLLEHSKTIAAVTLLTVTAAVIYLLLAKPLFVATTTVLLDTGRGVDLFNAAPISGQVTSDQSRVENQIEVIKSDRVASSVISRLKLRQRPEFASSPSVIERLLAWFTPTSIATASGAGSSTDQTELREVASRFADRLSTRRIGQSLVIEIAFSLSDPEMAAEIANATAESFIKSIVEAKSQSAEQQGGWLSGRLETLQQQAFEAARKVNHYRSVGDSNSSQDARAKLEELESIARSYRTMYDDFQRQYNQTLQRISYPDADVRIISRASVPLGKSSPRTSLVLGFAIVLGGLGGTVLAATRVAGDRALRSPSQLSSRAGIYPLGAINDLSNASSWWSQHLPWTSGNAMARDGREIIRRIVRDKLGPSARNDLRRIRTAIAARAGNPDVLCIGVVACSDGEGATTAAACLAVDYARSGVRTLLVDACEERRTLSEEFAAEPSARPHESLPSEPAALTMELLPDADEFLLPAKQNADLIEQIAERIAKSRGKFERIIVDLPAVLSSDPWRRLIPSLDQVILVVDYGKTSIDDAKDSKVEIALAGGTLLGAIINRVPRIARRAWTS